MKKKNQLPRLVFGCLITAMVIAAGLVFAGCKKEAEGKPVKLIFAHNQTSLDHSFHFGAVKFKEELERISGGQILVEVHAGDLGTNESELIEKVKLGAADFCIASPSFMAQVGVKEVDLMAFTYLFDDMGKWASAIDGEFGNLVRDSVKKNTGNDFQILGYYIAGVREIYANKFIKSAADIKGMKIRVQNSPVCTEYWAALGAVPASIGSGELYQALQQKTVDGAENSISYIVLNNHNSTENGRFVTETHHDFATRPLFVNGKKFDKLTEQQKGWITEAVRVSAQSQRDEDARLTVECRDRAIADGTQFYTPATSEIQFMIDAAKKQQDEFAAKQGLTRELQIVRNAR